MNVHGDNKKQFKLFCIQTCNNQEILSKEGTNEFDFLLYPKETLWLLVADTFNCDHHSTDSRAPYATFGQCF